MKRIGVIGGRGYVGRELLSLLAADPHIEVAFVASKGAAGKTAAEAMHAVGRYADLVLEDVQPEDVAKRGVDGIVLGLSNGQSAPWVAATPPIVRIVDLSADHRFVDAGWVYGLTEKYRAQLRGCQRVSNPGCYATATQLSMWPFEQDILRASVFGVSGYSGAGNTPSPKNDLSLLEDGLMPYDLAGHTQERELRRHTGLDVRFFPHVAPFFRGISVTIALDLKRGIGADEAYGRLAERYEQEPLIDLSREAIPPLVRQVREQNGVIIGGITAVPDEQRLMIVAVIDNLLKGAATQALQNLHLALDLPEWEPK